MNYIDQLQPYDIIVVYNPSSWLHRLIYRVTDYKAGHVALYIGDGKIYQAGSKGVLCKDLKNYSSKCKIWICRYMDLIPGHKILLKDFCEKSAGKKYAFLQLLMIWFSYTFGVSNVPDVSKKAMICSEFVSTAFNYAFIKLSEKDLWNITPADILNSDKLWRIECQ